MLKCLLRILIILFCLYTKVNLADACAGCWVGYGPGAERYNKALADLRILYETQGKVALPQFKSTLKQSNDPLVQKRAIEYIADLEDTEAGPLLEAILYELVKRVSFSAFGVQSTPFQTRLTAAHTLARLGSTRIADKIWQRYSRIDLARKSEVPYILNALGDPKLSDRLIEIVVRCEDHQLVVSALTVLAIGGNEKALPFLKMKVDEWRTSSAATAAASDSFTAVEYSIWRIKAEQAILKIKERSRN